MFDPLYLLLLLPVIAVAAGLLFTKRGGRPKREDGTKPPATNGTTHSYDPKEGLMIVTGRENPAVQLPELSSDQRRIVDEYLRLGKDLGLAISYFPHGASVNEAFLKEFIQAEQKYVDLGFRTISLHAFEGLGGWNQPLPADQQPCVKRADGETPALVGPPTMERLREMGRLY